MRYLRACRRSLASGAYRRYLALRTFPPKDLFQLSNHTSADRYPDLFKYAQQSLGLRADPRVLSFGCSTGEEVFSLRRYLPNALIKGIDINSHNIELCRRRLVAEPDDRLTFEVASSVMREAANSFDAIFCLAVFRHGDLTPDTVKSCDHRIKFGDFNRHMNLIADRIKPRGLLFLAHCNFLFSDAAASAGFDFEHRFDTKPPNLQTTPIFDRDNQRTQLLNGGAEVFRKRGSGSQS
jgi:SAM-dependent methyltransferase